MQLSSFLPGADFMAMRKGDPDNPDLLYCDPGSVNLISYDPATKRLFAFNGRSKDVTAIEGATGQVAGTIALDGKPEFPVTDGAGNIYDNIEDKSEIVRIDPDSGVEIARRRVAINRKASVLWR